MPHRAACKVNLDTKRRGCVRVRVIKTFRSRGLKAFWTTGAAGKIKPDLITRLIRRLDALNAATVPGDLNIPGFDFHKLRGKPVRYSVHINGPWCVTFGWDGEDAIDADLEQYH
jgi:proteic killer suppression protein